MIKDAIGILDSGVEGFSVLETLTKSFVHENFIYINDLKHYPYYNMTEEESINLIKENIKRLLEHKIKLLIVTSDVIVEFIKDELEKLDILVFDVVSVLIDYINEYYEQKNIVLFAKNEILEANLYQKNFKYNRLYNIQSDDLEELICNKGLKTSQSFIQTKETFKQLRNKPIDVIIASSPFLTTLETEIFEFVRAGEITNLGEILETKINNELMDLNSKGRGKLIVYSNVEKSKFKHLTAWSDLKYKYIDFDKKSRNKKQKATDSKF